MRRTERVIAFGGGRDVFGRSLDRLIGCKHKCIHFLLQNHNNVPCLSRDYLFPFSLQAKSKPQIRWLFGCFEVTKYDFVIKIFNVAIES